MALQGRAPAGDPAAERDTDGRRSIAFVDAARKVRAEHVEPANETAEANARWLSSLERRVFPKMGKRPAFAADQADVLRAPGPVRTERPETARRGKPRVRTVPGRARANGLGEGAHPADGIETALPRRKTGERRRAAAPHAELPALRPRLEAVDGMGAPG